VQSFEVLTPDVACRALAAAGFLLTPSELQVEAREGRWLVRVPGERVAWFAASENGLRRLQTERRVLRLLEARCTFRVPQLLFESATGAFDSRAMVPGRSDPWRIYAEVRENVDLAVQLGTAVGTLLSEQHSRIDAGDVAGWLPRQPSWPEPQPWVRERLGKVVNDGRLIADAEAVMDAYEEVFVSEADRALVHTDIGLHNLAIDSASYAVRGIFNYDEAAWADRHHDFRYLVFDFERYDLLDAALSAYEPVVGRRIQRNRVLLYNAACAVTFLANRAGTEPEDRSCGRTLAQDLHWSKHAIAKVRTL
jgi:Phosphotransferase enzyme family